MSADSLIPGSHYGAWILVRPLGSGGMGAVWLAQRDGEQGALKISPKPSMGFLIRSVRILSTATRKGPPSGHEIGTMPLACFSERKLGIHRMGGPRTRLTVWLLGHQQDPEVATLIEEIVQWPEGRVYRGTAQEMLEG